MNNNNKKDIMRKQFMEAIERKTGKNNSALLKRDRYDELVRYVKRIKKKGKKIPQDYWLVKHYDIIKIQNVEKLIVPIKQHDSVDDDINDKETTENDGNNIKDRINSNIIYYVTIDDVFDILYDTHISIGHGGRDRMMKEISTRYKNITFGNVKTFLDICIECQMKKCREKKGLVVKPILSHELNSRCQIDLIDFQTAADGKYKFILVWQDNLTKFVQLRALESKRGVEIAQHMIDIFCIFGAPNILQSDNGREFTNRIIESLKELWPQLKIVHGKPRYSASQGSVERANRDIEEMIFTWMQDHRTKKWTEGLSMVQFMKNRAYHSGIGRSPYKAMFGKDPKVGLATSRLPKEIIDSLEYEEDLENIIDHIDDDNSDNDDDNDNNRKDNNVTTSQISTRYLTRNSKRLLIQTNTSNIEEEEIQYCQKCKQSIDGTSSSTLSSNRKRKANLCSLCIAELDIDTERTASKKALYKQAEKMTRTSTRLYTMPEIGMTVRVSVPDVDRGRADGRSILAVVLKKENTHNMFQLGTKEGILQRWYVRSQFSVCNERLVNIEDVPLNKTIPLRTIATVQSLGKGQGFRKCYCQQKCITKRCICIRNNVKCNSKCHNSTTCKNK